MVVPAKAGTPVKPCLLPSEETFLSRLSNFLDWVPAFAATTSSYLPFGLSVSNDMTPI